MRLIFMGSPVEVVAPLNSLLESNHEVVAVVSQPAKPMGRKRVMTDPPLATFAKEKGLLVLQPEKASNPDFLDQLKGLKPDVIVTAAYGQILTDSFLAIPARGTINIHPSLLPRYRGAIPVQAALLNGDKTTGVTILFTVKKLDAGNIILQREFPIDTEITADKLLADLFAHSGDMVVESLELLRDPDFGGIPQDDAEVSHCKKISKDDGIVDWQNNGSEILNRFRAYNPWPGTFTWVGDRRITIEEIKPDNNGRTLNPGAFEYDKSRSALVVGTGSGSLLISRLKPAGGKSMDAAGFWNGLKDPPQFTSPEELNHV